MNPRILNLSEGIEIIVECSVYSLKDFIEKKPPFSIAIDGFVRGRTRRVKTRTGPYATFDHHEGVDRTVTLSTCMQVYEEIRKGLFNIEFQVNGKPHAFVYTRSGDEDSSTTCWEFKRLQRIMEEINNPRIIKFIRAEDQLDRYMGNFPLEDKEFYRVLAWVFEPYNQKRFDGTIENLKGPQLKEIIDAVGLRIDDYVDDKGSELELEGSYERLGGGEGWHLIRETGPAARLATIKDNITTYVRYIGPKDQGHAYAVVKNSPWAGSNSTHLFRELNRIERKRSDIITKTNRWGGGNLGGGSPQETGSMIPPDELPAVMNKIILKAA